MNFVKSFTIWHAQWCMESNYETFWSWNNASLHHTLQLNYIFVKTQLPYIPKTSIWKCSETTNNQPKCDVIQVRQTLSINIVSRILLGNNLSFNTPFYISFAFFYSNFMLHSLSLKHNTYLHQCNNYSNKRSSKKMLQ
jgi:hypothetical protein